MKLYEAGYEMEAVLAQLEANGGELTDELAERLGKVEGDFDAKAERVALKIREMELDAATASSEAQRLAGRAKAKERAADSLRAYLLSQMQRVDRSEVKSALVTIRVQQGPPAVRFSGDTLDLPPGLCRVVPPKIEVDAKAVLGWAATGQQLPEGVEIVRNSYIRFY